MAAHRALMVPGRGPPAHPAAGPLAGGYGLILTTIVIPA
jgi:hypothetical protein